LLFEVGSPRGVVEKAFNPTEFTPGVEDLRSLV